MVNSTPTPTKGLSHAHEVFAQALARGLTKADAYREAYPKSKNWLPASASNKASNLAKNPAIAARLLAIRAPIIRDIQLNTAGYGLIQAMDEAKRAYDLAESTNQPGVMVAATQLRAKLNALLIDRKEIAVTQLDGFDPSEKLMMLDQLQAALAERKRLAMGDVTDVEAKGG